MLAVDPVKRLTVPEILAVPWVAVGMPRYLQPKRPVTPGMGTLHPAYPHHPGIIGRGTNTNGNTPLPSNGNTPAVSSSGSERSSIRNENGNGHAGGTNGAGPMVPPTIDTSSTHMLGTLASLVNGGASEQCTPVVANGGGLGSLRHIKGIGKIDETIVGELAERCGVSVDEVKMALLREEDNAVKVAYMLARDSTRVGCGCSVLRFWACTDGRLLVALDDDDEDESPRGHPAQESQIFWSPNYSVSLPSFPIWYQYTDRVIQ